MTGRYAANTGLTWPLFPASPVGLPTDIPTLPEVLLRSGYNTAMSGKWHLGNSQWKQTPVGRGFNSYTGCYMWDVDYFNKQYYYAPWEPLATDWVSAHRNGSYRHFNEPRHSTDAISANAVQMVRQHVDQNSNRHGHNMEEPSPMFLYVSFTAGHSPLQPAAEDLASCMHISHLWRRQFCGLLVGVDRNLRELMEVVQTSLGDDTVVVIASDNGASTWFGGMNQPYRGGKTTSLQGGVLVPAFAMDLSFDGRYFGLGGAGDGAREYSKLMHISDWFPTMLSLAGITRESFNYSSQTGLGCHMDGPGSGPASGLETDAFFEQLDGMDLSSSIRHHATYSGMAISSACGGSESGSRTVSAGREELLLDMYYPGESCFEGVHMESYLFKDLKFINGTPSDSAWYRESSGRWTDYSTGVYDSDSSNNDRSLCSWIYRLMAYAVNIYELGVVRLLEGAVANGESLVGPGALDSTRIMLTHSMLLPHLAYVRSLQTHLMQGTGAFGSTYSDTTDTIDTVWLFNITSDPYEQHSLDVRDYPVIMAHIRSRLDTLKGRRPQQQKFWLQLHPGRDWPKTFVGVGAGVHISDYEGEEKIYNASSGSGSGSGGLHRLSNTIPVPKDCTSAGCKFIHPWIDDHTNTESLFSDPTLVSGLDVANKKLHNAMIVSIITTMTAVLFPFAVHYWCFHAS